MGAIKYSRRDKGKSKGGLYGDVIGTISMRISAKRSTWPGIIPTLSNA